MNCVLRGVHTNSASLSIVSRSNHFVIDVCQLEASLCRVPALTVTGGKLHPYRLLVEVPRIQSVTSVIINIHRSKVDTKGRFFDSFNVKIKSCKLRFLRKMNLQRIFICWQFIKVVSMLSGVLFFNHTSSFVLFRLFGLTSVSMIIVYVLCFSTLLMFWCGFQRTVRARGSQERQRLLNELRSIEPSKIPFVIDRFVELDRAKDQKVRGATESTDSSEKLCVACLDAEACIQTLPCSHVVVCGWCAWQSLKIAYQQGLIHRCAVCRCEIQDFSGSLIRNLTSVNWKDVEKIVEEIRHLN